MSRKRSNLGVTLLEAVLAVAILSAALVVCLELRASAIRSVEALSDRHAVDREIETLFEMARTGILGEPQSDRETRGLFWAGEHLGRPYRISASVVRMENPVRGVVGRRENVSVWRYSLSYAGREAEMLWY